MLKKIRLLKQISKLAKEVEKVCKENDATLRDLHSFIEQGKVLFPRIGDILESIAKIAENHKR